MPLSPDLEKDILVALLRDHKLLVWASTRLRPEDFTNQVYGEVWYIMRRLWNKYSEEVTFSALRHEVEQAIESQDFLPEDVNVLIDLFKSLQSGKLMQNWTAKRLEKWLDQKAHESYASEVNRAIMEGRSDQIHDAYRDLQRRVAKPADTHDIMDEEVWLETIRQKAEEHNRLISTGVAAIDDVFGGGMFRGEFGMIFGVENVGKSFFGIQVGFNAWVTEHRTLHITNEDTLRNVRTRYLTKLTETPKDRMAPRETHLMGIREAKEARLRGMLSIQYIEPGESPDAVAGYLEEARLDGEPYEMVVVDYLDNFRTRSPKNKPLWEELMEVSAQFSHLAKEYDVCIMAITHADSKGYDRKFLGAKNMGLSKVGKNKVVDFAAALGQDEQARNAGLIYLQVTKLRNREIKKPRLVCEQAFGTASFIPKQWDEVETDE